MVSIAHCVHAVPGRVRYRIPERRGDQQFFRHAAEVLKQDQMVEAVLTNALTASILVRHCGSAEDISGLAERSGLFRVHALPTVSMGAQAGAGLQTIDRNLKRISNGRVDMNTALFLGLGALAVHQVMKGNLLAPASTLLWYALETLRRAEGKP